MIAAATGSNQFVCEGRKQSTEKIVSLALELVDPIEQEIYDGTLEKLSSLDALYHQGDVSVSSLPPLDQITACSETDDASSVSSVSSLDEDEVCSSPLVAPRSIFKPYWVKNGPSASLRRASVESLNNEGSTDTSSASETYEETLKVKEQDKPSSPGRRRIFGEKGVCFSKSEPQLSLALVARNTFRKTQSSSTLKSHPKESCLRSGRYSFSSQKSMRRDSSRSDSSVSFSEDVDVVVYQKPVERYAQTGWSKWFV